MKTATAARADARFARFRKPPITINELASQLLISENFDAETAIEKGVERMLVEPHMLEDIARSAMTTAVMRLLSQQRERLHRAASSERADALRGMAANAEETYQEYLDTWHIGKIRLGDCTKTELLHEASILRATVKTLTNRERIYEAIAKKMPETGRVRDTWSADQIRKLAGRFPC